MSSRRGDGAPFAFRKMRLTRTSLILSGCASNDAAAAMGSLASALGVSRGRGRSRTAGRGGGRRRVAGRDVIHSGGIGPYSQEVPYGRGTHIV